MDIEEIEQTFEECDKFYLKFEWNETLPSKRPDLCAFLLLDRLVSKNRDMVCGAEHDEIYLDVNPRDLVNSKVTKEDIKFLVSCGVRFDYDGLRMFA